MSNVIQQPLGLIDHHNLKSDEEVLLTIDCEFFLMKEYQGVS
ncbi:hypothetical protein [Colwellia sp. UCD-KL20]|nr:hypothetical protein [Colwellia sp. UCD-KL20]